MDHRKFLLVSIWAVQAATAQSLGTVIGPGAVPASYNGAPIWNAFQNPVWLATTPNGALYLTSNMEPHLIDGMLLQLPLAVGLTTRLNTPVGNQITTELAGDGRFPQHSAKVCDAKPSHSCWRVSHRVWPAATVFLRRWSARHARAAGQAKTDRGRRQRKRIYLEAVTLIHRRGGEIYG